MYSNSRTKPNTCGLMGAAVGLKQRETLITALSRKCFSTLLSIAFCVFAVSIRGVCCVSVVRLAIERSRARLKPFALSRAMQPLARTCHRAAHFDATAKGSRCCAARKVTADIAESNGSPYCRHYDYGHLETNVIMLIIIDGDLQLTSTRCSESCC